MKVYYPLLCSVTKPASIRHLINASISSLDVLSSPVSCALPV
ncbi:MAG: hypothetical protein R2680_05510 [Nitrososphaeraceae archaeon]